MSDTAVFLLRVDCFTRGWTLNVRTRKLASGPKRYFRIRGKVYPHTIVSDVVKNHFPDSYLTSGSMGGLTGECDLTYSEGPRT